jgi:hypothetical protein
VIRGGRPSLESGRRRAAMQHLHDVRGARQSAGQFTNPSASAVPRRADAGPAETRQATRRHAVGTVRRRGRPPTSLREC